jgi:hypothetical protein
MFVQELKKTNFDFEKLPKDLRDAVDKLLEVPITKEDSQKVQLLDYTIIKSIANLYPGNEAVANIYNSIVKMEDQVVNDGFNTELSQGFTELEVGDKLRNALGILLTVVDKNETEYIIHSVSTPIAGNGLPWDKNKVHDYLSRGLWTRALKTTKMAKGGSIGKKYEDLSKIKPNFVSEPAKAKDNSDLEIRHISEVDIIKLDDFYFTGVKKIQESEDAAKIFLEFWNHNKINIQEEFSVLFLNRQNKPIGIYNLSKGGITGTVVDVELLVATTIKALAQGVVIAHNHPSGTLKPSPQDIQITKKIKEALKLFDISLLDSIIVVPSGNYYSLADNTDFEEGGELQSDIKKRILDAVAKPGEIKGVTTIEVSDDGKELKYGSKNNKTRLTVEGLSLDEIKYEVKFEQRILNRSIKEAEDFSEDAIWAMKGQTREEKLFAIKMHNSSLKVNEETLKILIPFYQTHISIMENEYAYGGEIHKETPGMERNTGNRPSPSAHASHHEIGTEAIGNDGNVWEVKADKNGTHAWKKTEKATANTSPQKSIHDLHELDLWVQFPDGRFYRKFVLNKDNFRAIADLGIKESITDLDNGMYEAIISVRDEAEAEKVSLLFMELYPQKLKESEDTDPKNNVKINNNDLNLVIDKKKPTGLLRHKTAAIEKIKKNAVKRFYSSSPGNAVSVDFWQELKPGDFMSRSISSFEVYDTFENSTIRIFALNEALLTDAQMELYSEYRAMFKKAFDFYFEFEKQEGNHNLIQEGYDYAINKLKNFYNFTPAQIEWINHEISFMAEGIVADFLKFVNHKIELRFEIEKLGKLEEKKEEEAPEVVIGYTAAPEAYDYNGAETLEVTEYFDDSKKPIRKVSIEKRGLKPQTDRYQSGGFGFFSKEEVEQIFAMGEHSIFKKKEEKKIDITAYKNPYELNRAIEAFLDANWDREEFTADEIIFISYYSGYGGLDKIGTFSKEEFKTILYEFFTPDDIVKKMWALAYKYGYGSIGDGSLLEPSVGIGAFLKYAPKNARTVANEINKYSAKICEILYPNAEVKLMPFEKNFVSKNLSIRGNIDELEKFSLVIGNPPYGKAQSKWLSMGDDKYVKAGNFTEYFISRGLDLLIKDGLLVYIVGAEQHTGGTLFLDSGPSKIKEDIFEKAELIDAYRLPINVFERTGVSSEIVIFKRK